MFLICKAKNMDFGTHGTFSLKNVFYRNPGRSKKFDKVDQVKPLEYVTRTDEYRFVFEDFVADI